MSSPIITDEELEQEKNTKLVQKKSVEEIVKENCKTVKDMSDVIQNDVVTETEKELEQDIPSSFIRIDLVSNGKIEGIPKTLHFRCYSASDALDLNTSDDDKSKVVGKVLSRLNYEKFDVSKLPPQDIVYILHTLHGVFISSKITKKVYIDDTIEDTKLLNDESNIEEVDIPIASIQCAYLGKDYDNNDLKQKIKVPFTIKDKATNQSVTFRFTILKDVIMAESYCRNYFKDEFVKFADIRTTLNKINSIKNSEESDKAMDKYLNENEEKVEEYYNFMMDFTKMVGKIIQAQQIVSYNGKELKNLDEKWKVYDSEISFSIWKKYDTFIKSFPFGLNEEIDVFIPSLGKKVHRRIGFQFDDFIHVDKQKDDDRCVIEFD